MHTVFAAPMIQLGGWHVRPVLQNEQHWHNYFQISKLNCSVFCMTLPKVYLKLAGIPVLGNFMCGVDIHKIIFNWLEYTG
jgi:hypothetical protein